MKQVNCDEILMAKMAELDGELPPDPETERHLAGCENCHREVAAIQIFETQMESHSRANVHSNIWPLVEARISEPRKKVGWQPFAVTAVGLVALKFIEMSLRNDPGFLFGLVPLVLAATLFIVLRENPFKVNAELSMEN